MEKNQMITPSNMATSNIGIMMAAGSGNLYFLKKRKTGKSMMLMKKAISTGIMMLWAITSMAMINTNPRSSIDRLTVSGMSVITLILYVYSI
jgi:hypothetical protein